MSVTTTDNPVSTTLHRAVTADHHLRDYDVHLTSDEAITAPASAPAPAVFPATNNRDAPRAQVSNPPDWPNDHRGMPPYRPINTGLDMSTRPWNGNPVGDAFVVTMFTGVFTIAVSNGSSS